MGASSDDVFLPDLAETIFGQPFSQFVSVRPREQGFWPLTIGADDMFQLAFVEQLRALGGNDDLCVMTRLLEQRHDHRDGVRMKPDLGFIDDDELGKLVVGLQQECDQRHRPQGSIRELMRPELVVGPDLLPVQQDSRRIECPRSKAEIIKKGAIKRIVPTIR